MSYNFSEVLGIWWHGRWQAVLLAIPLIKPGREGNKAPAWFRVWYASWVWAAYLDADRRPTEQWLFFYDFAARGLFYSWLDDLRGRAVSDAFAAVVGLTGRPKHGYYTLSDWLEAAWTRVQFELPEWVWQLSGAITTAANGVIAWARARYDDSLAKVATLWTWLQGRGSLLSAWYDQIGTWIADFAQNPRLVILGVLGGTWARLVTFDGGALSYYYNLWGSYRQTLADFLADPLGYLWDRIEDFILSKW